MTKSQKLLEKARAKWARLSANKSLPAGERIKLIYEFSLEAERLRSKPNNIPKSDVRRAFCDIYTDPVKGKKINNVAAARYLRLHRLAATVIDQIVEQAAVQTPLLTMSHAVTLAEVDDKAKQMKLLKKTIRSGLSVRRLREEATSYRDVSMDKAFVRHKVLIRRLDAAANNLDELLKELTKSKQFSKTIEKSDRRSKSETAGLLRSFKSSMNRIGKKLEKAKAIADQAKKELS